MKKWFIPAVALILCLTACASDAGFSNGEMLSNSVKRTADSALTYNYADGVRETPTALNSFANSATAFSFKLLRRLYDGEAVSLAPMNSVLQLGLLANGAKGDTRTEILLALGGEADLDTINTCCSYFKSRMNSVGQQTLTLGGTLFVNEKTDVRKAFLQTNADYYGDDVIRCDFQSSADKLNAYLGGSTFSLKADEDAVSSSTLRLTDEWLSESLTSEEFFMETDAATGVVKYTRSNPLKAVFITPKGDFDAYVKTFDSAEYGRLLESVDVTKRKTAAIPAFQAKAQTTELSATLKQIGLYTLFDEGSDFGNLAYTENLRLNAFYDSVPPLTVTAQGIFTDGRQPATADTADAETTVDRPFLFMLTDNETDVPIYISVIE